ncbi:uncharacterized protein MCYG_00470 [Microsporum canis CBS 113480]|uniref:Uncharacterized protein n=1 Tax=Arthroderma otae (strain ATCC MYA-4605 / CBS 113480) TaxID=554155 RepID=C5FCP8_ARTOC|nr:uncharacterized protein MCYG_00470 [Microsporum canis CBS 113480]EEQ27582.1 predicted protein [Microsporum canis CBS 113480]
MELAKAERELENFRRNVTRNERHSSDMFLQNHGFCKTGLARKGVPEGSRGLPAHENRHHQIVPQATEESTWRLSLIKPMMGNKLRPCEQQGLLIFAVVLSAPYRALFFL